jgi:hypothetical protein
MLLIFSNSISEMVAMGQEAAEEAAEREQRGSGQHARFCPNRLVAETGGRWTKYPQHHRGKKTYIGVNPYITLERAPKGERHVGRVSVLAVKKLSWEDDPPETTWCVDTTSYGG